MRLNPPVSEDTAEFHQAASRADCYRDQVQPTAEDNNEAGKDGDMSDKLCVTPTKLKGLAILDSL